GAWSVKGLLGLAVIKTEIVCDQNKLPAGSGVGVGVCELDDHLLAVGDEPHPADGISVIPYRSALGKLSPELLLAKLLLGARRCTSRWRSVCRQMLGSRLLPHDHHNEGNERDTDRCDFQFCRIHSFFSIV